MRGQALVEGLLVIPLTVLLLLGIVQLACVEHARLLTEYAAFQAARAGVVWNASNVRMRDAARLALLPLMGPTDSTEALAQTYVRTEALDRALAQQGLGRPEEPLAAGFHQERLLGLVRVDLLSPTARAGRGNWKVPEGDGWQELDFDAPDSFPDVPGAEQHFREVFREGRPDIAGRALRDATLLEVRVRCFYELRIPFANWVVFTAWFAANVGRNLFGAVDRPSLSPGNALGTGGSLEALGGLGRGLRAERGLAELTRAEMGTLWALAMHGRAGVGKRVLLPLSATYVMRMQSNVYRKWVVHDGP